MSGTIFSLTSLLSSEFVDNTTNFISPTFLRNGFESGAGAFQAVFPANPLPNPFITGATNGITPSPGVFPGTWFQFGQGTLVLTIIGSGVTAQGYPYCDIQLSGTTSTAAISIFVCGATGTNASRAIITPSVSWTGALGLQLVSGTLTASSGTVTVLYGMTSYNSIGTELANVFTSGTITPAGTMAEFSQAAVSPGTAVAAELFIELQFTSGVTLSGAPVLRIANPQIALSTSNAYTAVLTDRSTEKQINWPGSFTYTIPAGVFAGGHVLPIRQTGAGQVSLVGATGVVPVSSTGTLTTRTQGSLILATCDANIPNLWRVDGDLS